MGHVAAGMAAKPLAREVNLGLLVFAALLLDVLLWIFVLVGLEQVVVPSDFARHPYLSFVFPYSHSLVACVTWSLAAAAVAWRWARTTGRQPRRAMLATSLAVFSHFVLDAVVHVKDLPLDRDSPIRFGTGLWEKNMPAALGLEILLVVVGAFLYARAVLPGGFRLSMLIGMLALCAGMTVAGATLQKTPPAASVAAWSGIVAIVVVSAVLGFVDSRNRA